MQNLNVKCLTTIDISYDAKLKFKNTELQSRKSGDCKENGNKRVTQATISFVNLVQFVQFVSWEMWQ